MAPVHLAYMYVYSTGAPMTALWCDSCMVPSGIGTHYVMLSSRGSVMRRGVVAYCNDCGRRWEPCP